ncbi:MAG: UDP-N-acetylmuramoyl-L-alanine--D-glutamate ligase [Verrucomicrobia bacterium]|nr:MAG: UDP-N-acetylmuramoylalanine--D-glutamate ligase [Verrucomicrobia bacterium 13_2_20CM_54_12]OLB43164.1 MAG: UDP-N-acetylmuramoylalanine--D-glutamate ligase [Verrucomicrobia bacterium 13_2_20CM_2_54_15]OLD72259.1 MAG: UDP-N-acetylmuramoylalanine--D-glutamate ligase [Verrucomicrobia bacterium 13_1_20CM_54_28]OLD86734.1 MAG: UDP-N-acetylmuramoylalanine--D-glutamate ligase [Verrucomicrobia bacterium 13_1_20CM_4_54_11]PYK16823.1 MAG: UDP-N-acetylmuramoyl-L-alanine--D-glutamate ligase [Verruco
MRYKNQNIAVLGAGLSGSAAALLLISEGAQVTVLDSAEEKNLLKSTIDNLRAQNVRVICGAAADAAATTYHMAVLSPGIDPASRLVRNFSSRGIDIISELELGWRFCDKIPVIAVTGTNGKTTTTELLAQTLNACGQRTIACGNIGKPLSEVAREKQPFDVLTVEVSSFQLETIRTFHPSISLWLNFAPDHLDRYRSVAEYRAAKLRIFENQTNADVAVVNAIEKIPNIRPRTITFSAYANGGDFRLSEGAILYGDESVLRLANTKLRGLHNIENLMATLAVGMARGLSFEQMVPPLSAYEPRPHRCEFVREVNGVAYVNDSKATNLDAVDKALRAQTKPVILIAGGKDKGFSFDPLRSLVKEKVKSTILIGEIADSIKRSWADAVESEIASSLADAVERAHSSAKPGEMVLFSPGTSSFDMFKSYADRGDQFRALVRALPET